MVGQLPGNTIHREWDGLLAALDKIRSLVNYDEWHISKVAEDYAKELHSYYMGETGEP